SAAAADCRPSSPVAAGGCPDAGCPPPSASAAPDSLAVGLPVHRLEDVPGALSQQILGHRHTQLLGLGFGTAGLCGQQPAAIGLTDQATQPEFSVAAFGVTGDGHLTATVEMVVQRPFGAHPQGAVLIDPLSQLLA